MELSLYDLDDHKQAQQVKRWKQKKSKAKENQRKRNRKLSPAPHSHDLGNTTSGFCTYCNPQLAIRLNEKKFLKREQALLAALLKQRSSIENVNL